MALIVFTGFTLLGTLASVWSYRSSVSEKRSMMTVVLHQTARYVTAQHVDYGLDFNDPSVNMGLAFASAVSGFDLIITDAGGVVRACSERNFGNCGMRVPYTLIQEASEVPSTVRRRMMGDICHERRHVVGMPLTRTVGTQPQVFGYIFVSTDMSVLIHEWRGFSGMFILIALGVMTLTIGITLVTTKRMTKPLNEIADAARRFARGDFAVRVKDGANRQDEIGQLTHAFNAMADSLESSESFRRDFIANLSHELKTPMTIISGFAEGLLDGTIPQENKNRYLSVISSETRRLSRLVKSMLEMSSIHSAKSDSILDSSFDVSEVVRLALLSLGGKIESRRLDVETNLPEEPVITRGDGDAITQVVYNLIENAIKFSDSDSVIRLELWKQGSLAYVSVENHGETITDEDLPHIFNRFHKGDKSRSFDKDGVGLGLYIVKTILDNHNQDIFVESRDGITKFVFTLEIL